MPKVLIGEPTTTDEDARWSSFADQGPRWRDQHRATGTRRHRRRRPDRRPRRARGRARRARHQRPAERRGVPQLRRPRRPRSRTLPTARAARGSRRRPDLDPERAGPPGPTDRRRAAADRRPTAEPATRRARRPSRARPDAPAPGDRPAAPPTARRRPTGRPAAPAATCPTAVAASAWPSPPSALILFHLGPDVRARPLVVRRASSWPAPSSSPPCAGAGSGRPRCSAWPPSAACRSPPTGGASRAIPLVLFLLTVVQPRSGSSSGSGPNATANLGVTVLGAVYDRRVRLVRRAHRSKIPAQGVSILLVAVDRRRALRRRRLLRRPPVRPHARCPRSARTRPWRAWPAACWPRSWARADRRRALRRRAVQRRPGPRVRRRSAPSPPRSATWPSRSQARPRPQGHGQHPARHGGVLDRFDALLFVLPAAYYVAGPSTSPALSRSRPPVGPAGGAAVGRLGSMTAPRVALAGSTGSIGTQTLEVLAAEPDRFELTALGASGRQLEALVAQAEAHPTQGRRRRRRGRRRRAGRPPAAVRGPGRRRRPGQPGRGGRRRRQRRRRASPACRSPWPRSRPAAAWRWPTRSRSSPPVRSCSGPAARRAPSWCRSTASTAPSTSACGPTTIPARVARLVLTASGGPFRGRTGRRAGRRSPSTTRWPTPRGRWARRSPSTRPRS